MFNCSQIVFPNSQRADWGSKRVCFNRTDKLLPLPCWKNPQQTGVEDPFVPQWLIISWPLPLQHVFIHSEALGAFSLTHFIIPTNLFTWMIQYLMIYIQTNVPCKYRMYCDLLCTRMWRIWGGGPAQHLWFSWWNQGSRVHVPSQILSYHSPF